VPIDRFAQAARHYQKPGASGCEPGDCRTEPTVQDGGADLKNPICATKAPTHLSPFVHPGVDQIVHKAFGARRGNWLSLPPPSVIVDHRVMVVSGIGLEVFT
jgi:hypothetical protein